MVKKTKNLKYYEGIGRRKEAVARVRLYILGKKENVLVNGLEIKAGEIYINNKPIREIYNKVWEEKTYHLPLEITGNSKRFAISIKVYGGGKRGQLEAITLGITRALVLVNQEYKPILRKYGLLTRDSRVRQRRQVGTGGKARRKKQSPKR